VQRKVRGPHGWDIRIPLHQAAHTVILEDGIEYWDFYSDEFVLEAWELMAFGGVHVRA
jgi:hypothetical protein